MGDRMNIVYANREENSRMMQGLPTKNTRLRREDKNVRGKKGTI